MAQAAAVHATTPASGATRRQDPRAHALDAAFLRPLPILLAIAGVLTILTAPWTAYAVGGRTGTGLAIVYGILGLLVLVLAGWMRKAKPSATMAYALTALLAITYLAADLVYVRLADAIQFNSELWLLMGAGFVFLRIRWLHAVMAVTAVSWSALFATSLSDPLVQQYGSQVLAGIVFGYTAHLVRRRSLVRLADLEISRRTAHEAADANLRSATASEAQLRTLTENAPLGIFQTDPRGLVVYANGRWGEIAGCDYRDFAAIRRAVHPDDVGRLTTAWRAAMASGTELVISFRYVHNDGRVHDVHTRAMPMRDATGNLTGYVGTLEDVSARGHAERKFQSLLESAPDAMVIVDAEGRIAIVNGQAESMFGSSRATLLGKEASRFLPDAFSRPPPARPRTNGVAGPPASKGASVESWAMRADGSQLPVEVTLAPIETEEGHMIVAAVRDITVRKEAQQADRIAFARLLEIEQLKELDRFKTRILNTASHELNTPITPIKLQVHLLGAGVFGDLNKDQAKSVQILKRNIERLAALVAEVLDVARLQSGRLKLQPRILDVGETIDQAAEGFLETARAAKVKLRVQRNGDLHALADAQRLSQVLDNLLSNAIKFTPAGGHVDVRATRKGDAVEVRVQDTGIGLDGEQIRRLFQPFSQVHDPLTLERPGTGLGLYISKGLVAQHGGDMDAESGGRGMGSTFWFRLPVAGPSQAARQAEDADQVEVRGLHSHAATSLASA